jgi:hypothetical protein
MASRYELSEFERGLLVGARQRVHSISQVVQPSNIPRSKVLRVYQNSTTHRGQRSGRPRVLNYRDQRRLARAVRANRQAKLAGITSIFDSRDSRLISSWSVQRSSASVGHGAEDPPECFH